MQEPSRGPSAPELRAPLVASTRVQHTSSAGIFAVTSTRSEAWTRMPHDSTYARATQIRTAAAGAAIFSASIGGRGLDADRNVRDAPTAQLRTRSGGESCSSMSSMSDPEEDVVSDKMAEDAVVWDDEEHDMCQFTSSGLPGSAQDDVNAALTDGGVGRRASALPQAVSAVDKTFFRRNMRPAVPHVDEDLRRFVRPGDVLNYLGGNRWGHVVMAMSELQAFEAPTLYSTERLPTGCIPADAFPVRLVWTREQQPKQLELTIQGEDDHKVLVCGPVHAGGPIDVWSRQNSAQRLRAHDRILEANGIRGSPQEMLAACDGQQVLNLIVWRPAEIAVLGHNVPIYPVRVLQSASNMRDIAESTVCLIVHPLRKTICSVGPLREGFRINQGHMGPVEVQILLSPLSRITMDVDLFRLAVDEVTRAPRDQKWSMRTAVRSYLRHAELKPVRFKREKDKLKLGRKMSEYWAKRPICSTVPPRIWQKYLLKSAYKGRRGHHHGSFAGLGTGSGHGATGNFSAEATFAELVLQYVPLKDDRVLPADLQKILLGTGAWDALNLASGPPARRLEDQKPGSPSCQIPPPCRQRRPLPASAVNRDGTPVHLGADHFTVYCGQQVSRPKQATTRLLDRDGDLTAVTEISWDGRCGPLQGPQCAACRWLEDRLVE